MSRTLRKEVRVTDPFLKEILEYSAEINFVDQVSSDIAFQEQFLWFNSLREYARSVFFGLLSAVKQIRKNVTDTAETRDYIFETLSEKNC